VTKNHKINPIEKAKEQGKEFEPFGIKIDLISSCDNYRAND
jgi:hypothetical protein